MPIRIAFAFLCLTLVSTLSHQQAQAQGAAASPLEQRAQDVVLVMQGQKTAEAIFDDSFLAQVPPEKFSQLVAQLTTQFGPIIDVKNIEPQGPTHAKIVLRFKNAIGHGLLNIKAAAPHRINGLLLQTLDPVEDSLSTIRAELNKLPGQATVLFAPLDNSDDPVFAHNADQQMAIGSTFKLYILSALARSIESGERQWSDIVPLARKSFPSGSMQNWPQNAPVTLQTLATMMISISDNTATDILLHEVGRPAVEQELIASGHSNPARTLPLLSTLELFAFRGSPDDTAKYLTANDAEKRRILADFEITVAGNPDLVVAPRLSKPTDINTLEWFASNRDLQKILRQIVAFQDPVARDILSVSTALPAPRTEQWRYVGYKGGSEPGVLNLTWLLQDKTDAWHVLTLSWNNTDADVEKTTLELLAHRLLPFGL